MRFVIITQYFPPEVGAAQTRLAATAQGIMAAGHEVEVVTAMPNYPMGEIAQEYRMKFFVKDVWKGITVYRFWLWASQGKAIGRLMTYLTLMVTALCGVPKIKKPDFVFVNSGPIFMGLTGAIYSFLFRAPMIFFVADFWPRSVEHLQGLGARAALKLALMFEAWIYRQSKYVVAVTEGSKEILLKEKNLPPEKLLYLPNGVDTTIFYPRPVKKELIEKYNLQGKKVFMYTGNHGYAHALDSVVEAADLLKSYPKAVIMLVGGGSEKKKLKEMAAKKNLENLIFVDPVAPEILADYIQMADFGLIHVRNSPLAEETRPAKMFPMMAMAKPILFVGFGEGARLLEKVKGGWVIPAEQPALLKEKIIELCEHDAEAQVKGQNNLAFVTQELNFKTLVQNWLKGVKP